MYQVRLILSCLLMSVVAYASAEVSLNVGAETCEECHGSEYGVWSESKHFSSLDDAGGTEVAMDIMKALNGDDAEGADMVEQEDCMACHVHSIPEIDDDYNALVDDDGVVEIADVSGPSCESCHGSANKWVDVHSDEEGETDRDVRLSNAKAHGMINSSMEYDISSSCMGCHGLANESLKSETLKIMLDNGHPISKNFEVVAYSQGTQRHKFSLEGDNPVLVELDAAGVARLFIGGQLANYKAATGLSGLMANVTGNPQDIQGINANRIASAKSNLEAIGKCSPAVTSSITAFLSSPTDEAGRNVSSSIQDLDLSACVNSMLTDPAEYK